MKPFPSYPPEQRSYHRPKLFPECSSFWSSTWSWERTLRDSRGWLVPPSKTFFSSCGSVLRHWDLPGTEQPTRWLAEQCSGAGHGGSGHSDSARGGPGPERAGRVGEAGNPRSALPTVGNRAMEARQPGLHSFWKIISWFEQSLRSRMTCFRQQAMVRARAFLHEAGLYGARLRARDCDTPCTANEIPAPSQDAGTAN